MRCTCRNAICAPRHPRPGAPRRLRRARGEGGAAHRHRGRQQPTGAADRADRRLVDDMGRRAG